MFQTKDETECEKGNVHSISFWRFEILPKDTDFMCDIHVGTSGGKFVS
jgi:hypothetical protein